MIFLPLNIQRFASGSFESPGTKVSGGDYMYYRINWSSGSNGSSANSSNVYVDLYARKGSYTTTGTWTGYINIGGNTSNYSTYASVGTSWVHIGSYSAVIGHNADGSKDCWIGAVVNGPSGTSAGGYSINYGETKTLDKIPRYANITSFTVSKRDETSVTYSYTADATLDWARYSLDNTNWYDLPNNGVVSGLTANTKYTFYLAVRRKDSGLWSYSSGVSQTTYAYPYITNASNFVVGNDNTITIYNPVKREVLIQLQPNSSTEWYGTDKTTGTSIVGYKNESWRDIWYQYCTDKTSNTYRVKLTYGTHTDTTDYNYTYTINEEANNGEVKPKFNDFEIEDTNTKTLNLTGNANKLILNYSIPKGIITVDNKATANKYGTMSKYKMIIGEQTPIESLYSEDSTVNVVSEEPLSSNEITMYAIDTRGFSKGVTKQVNLLDYTIPTLNLLEAKLTRSNNNVGDQVTLTFDGTYWNKSFGNKTNLITKLTYKFKRTDSTEWSKEFDILPNIVYNENVFSYEHLISGDLDNYGFDISESYDIIVYYQDELYGSSFNLILNSSTPNIAIAKTGNAMMMPYDEELGGALQVAGDIVVVGGKVVQPGGGGEIVGDTLPIGSQIPFAGTIVPDGWLLCDGSAVSRTEYIDLFRAVGTSYGAGDGSTTFNLPNKKGKVSVGLDTSDTDFNTIGKTGGEKTHKLTVSEMPSHSHELGYDTGVLVASGQNYGNPGTGASYGQGWNTKAVGGSQAHNNLQPYQVDNWIIKAFQSAGVVAQVNNAKSESKLDTYSCDYINKKTTKSYAKGYFDSNINLTQEWQSASFTNAEIVGDKFELKNGRIYVKSGVSKVSINAIAFMEKMNIGSSYVWFFISKNGGRMLNAIEGTGAVHYKSIVIPNTPIQVKEGDYFTLEWNNPIWSADYQIVRKGIENTRLAIEEID